MSRTKETSLPSLLIPDVNIYGPPITSKVYRMFGVNNKLVGYNLSVGKTSIFLADEVTFSFINSFYINALIRYEPGSIPIT